MARKLTKFQHDKTGLLFSKSRSEGVNLVEVASGVRLPEELLACDDRDRVAFRD